MYAEPETILPALNGAITGGWQAAAEMRLRNRAGAEAAPSMGNGVKNQFWKVNEQGHTATAR
jgi:hypothetical protein